MFWKSVLIFSVLLFVGIKTRKDYGEYETDVLSYSLQTTEKYKDILYVESKLTKLTNGSLHIAFYTNVKKDMGVLGMKIRCFAWSEAQKQYKLSFNLNMANICEKQLAEEFLHMIPALTDKCGVSKGEYNFTIPDFNEIVHILTNGRFFYGKYMVLSDVSAKGKGRLLRSNVTAIIKPIHS